MTSGHLLFIPLTVIAGMILGFVLGARAARDRFELELKREKEREIARAARAERKRRRKAEEDPGGEIEASPAEDEGD